jgi:hypothetical protein
VINEISRAVERINARKVAAYGEPDEDGALDGGGVDRTASEQLVGLDLHPDEVSKAAVRAREMFELATASDAEPEDAAAGLWLEGLIIGLFIAQEREALASPLTKLADEVEAEAKQPTPGKPAE